jgi:Zn-dependent peptidase ImmA (M78 family)
MIQFDVARVRTKVLSILEDAGIEGPPIDLQRVSASLGLRVLVEDLGRLDACLIPHGQGHLVKLNSRVPRARRRFSLAHEIAHALFESELAGQLAPDPRLYRGSGAGDLAVERLCDAFAAELLMPYAQFRRFAVDDTYVSIQGIERLATLFGTSLSAAARRLAETADAPVVVAVWKPLRREPRPDTLCLSWAQRSAAATHLTHFFLPWRASPPPHSTPYRATRELGTVRNFERLDTPAKRPRFLVESRPFGGVAPAFVLSLVRLDKARQ